jgi:hypothetical protein
MSAPCVPVIVRVYVPAAVLVERATVSVDVAVGSGVTGVEIEHVAPAGHPVTARSTFPLNPKSDDTVTVDVPDPTCTSVIEDGLAEIEKFGGGLTVRKIDEVITESPVDPMIVRK